MQLHLDVAQRHSDVKKIHEWQEIMQKIRIEAGLEGPNAPTAIGFVFFPASLCKITATHCNFELELNSKILMHPLRMVFCFLVLDTVLFFINAVCSGPIRL